MKSLYFVFDQIPPPQSGGLIGVYRNIFQELKKDYNIKLVSIYNCEESYKKEFSDYQIIILNNYNIDNRFFRIVKYLKNRELKKVFKAIYSGILFFLFIPICRIKLKNYFYDNDKIIVTSPAAAIYMSKDNRFILEIHTKYEYFWKGSIASKLQVKLMTDPSLVVFRTKIDAKKAKCNKYKTDYIYNFAGEKIIRKVNVENRIGKFIFMGRLDKNKDPIRLIKIFESVKKEGKNVKLDIYGIGELEKNIKKYIEENRLENFISLKGFTTDKTVYNNYSAIVSASINEGLPLSILEAKRYGVPAIVLPWGDSTNEVVNNGVDGYIVKDNKEFEEKINEMITNTEQLKQLSINSLNSYENFTTSRFKVRYIEFIESYNKD
ncbi:MAG: glycosyltransferase [Thomasclavelia sp.]|uniref:glycosyltransferase n=1 Tax=Thomasclavelia sp. TaxID=3025757 RepID=UPI0039A31210